MASRPDAQRQHQHGQHGLPLRHRQQRHPQGAGQQAADHALHHFFDDGLARPIHQFAGRQHQHGNRRHQ
ncbi:hypothetical protein G6F57_023368 [Rhizopus arrhizus]|nr:hypothetical protein G6F22_021875 [Rhizopus arrhizus]KAG1425664.1 hypothetical protein G6F57_023368 [Rhizopus arrhizus]